MGFEKEEENHDLVVQLALLEEKKSKQNIYMRMNLHSWVIKIESFSERSSKLRVKIVVKRVKWWKSVQNFKCLVDILRHLIKCLNVTVISVDVLENMENFRILARDESFRFLNEMLKQNLVYSHNGQLLH